MSAPFRYDFVVDGSNVLLENKIGGKPSVRLFAALLHMLEHNGHTYKVWFDESIHRHLKDKGGDTSSFAKLLQALQEKSCVALAAHADPGIQADCQRHVAPVINGGDRNDSWQGYLPPIIRCRVGTKGKDILVYLVKAGTSMRLMSVAASHPFTYAGISFAELAQNGAAEQSGVLWAELPKFKGVKAHGNLLVLALDASGSMDQTDTYDGRPKHVHVNEILGHTIKQLLTSTIASSLYVCVLTFSDDIVVQHPDPASTALFSPVADWASAGSPDYLRGIDRGLTNIRLAIDRAADFVDGFRASDVAQALARRWDACTIVLLTDGQHCTYIGDRLETAKDIDHHVFATLNRTEQTSFGFIGLGTEAAHESMEGWATKATKLQLERAARMHVPLTNGALYVRVDQKSEHLQHIVRGFIDVASSR